MISGEIYRVIYFLAKKPTFDQCMPQTLVKSSFISKILQLSFNNKKAVRLPGGYINFATRNKLKTLLRKYYNL